MNVASETSHDVMEEFPLTFKDVINGPESENWISAMNDELKSMENNCVWNLVTLPENGKIINSKWVYKKKVGLNGDVTYRARLIAQGYNMQKGVDYEETFSPVVRFDTVRTLLIVIPVCRI